jgi:hypothetical protein
VAQPVSVLDRVCAPRKRSGKLTRKGSSACYGAQAAHSQPPTLLAPGSGSVKSSDQSGLLSPCQSSSPTLKWPAGICLRFTASVLAVSFRPRHSSFKSVVVRVPHVAHDRLPPVSNLLYFTSRSPLCGPISTASAKRSLGTSSPTIKSRSIFGLVRHRCYVSALSPSFRPGELGLVH